MEAVGHKDMSKEIIHAHLATAGKVAAGGVATGGGTYVATEQFAVAQGFDIAQATAVAGLLAACMTALYFGIMAAAAAWKLYKDIRSGKA